jgi:potassium-transporting ATPase KdpC subunit
MNTTLAGGLDGRGGSPIVWLRFALVAMVLMGIVFPVMTAGIGRGLFPDAATGSLLRRDGVVVGSRLVAQPFAADRYFTPRPSAANFDPRALAGSNLAPSNPALAERIAATSATIAAREHVTAAQLPADLVTASGSGIDPHISPAAAALQVARVAAARGIDEAKVREIVAAHTQDPTSGLLGQARVNVLELNLALDAPAR